MVLAVCNRWAAAAARLLHGMNMQQSQMTQLQGLLTEGNASSFQPQPVRMGSKGHFAACFSGIALTRFRRA